jgi:hypothetical protein
MEHVSRPLIALLVATVAFFALWIVALKPSSKSSSSNPGAYQSAIKAAHQAVAASNSSAHPGSTPTAPTSAPGSTPSPPATSNASASASAPATSTPTATTPGSATTATGAAKATSITVVHQHDSQATRHRLNVVTVAIVHRRVVALLFYNPAATDDRAVKAELAAVPTHHKRVVKLAVPINELAHYPVVTTQVPVNQSPTLVLIDSKRQASTIVGFADRFEIAQRVQDALALH